MSRITGRLNYKIDKNELLVFSDDSMRFYWHDDCTGEYLELTKGDKSNGASFPFLIDKICKPDGDDILIPSFFHDGCVNEHGIQLWVMIDGRRFRIPSWNESAVWFFKIMQVRQRLTRRKHPWYRKWYIFVIDLVYRVVCFSGIMAHGVFRRI